VRSARLLREDVSESALRAAIARKLPFKCEIMICPARDVIKLASKDPFSQQPSGPNIVRFVSVLAKRLRALPPLPLSLPSDDDWLVKIIAIQDRFVLGLYRRQMKAISYLGKIEKLLGVPVTTRSWNTIEKVVKILSEPTRAGRLRPVTVAGRDRKPPNSADQKQLQRLKAANGDQEEQRSHNA
jgi:uncharacterized protein (DUF1697 family)